MGPNRQAFLHQLATPETLLGREARTHPHHCVPSSFSLVTQDVEEGAPRSVQDGFRQGMVLDHVEYVQVLNDNPVILFSIGLGHFEMEIPPLSRDLEMG